jgi:hypothetical protein
MESREVSENDVLFQVKDLGAGEHDVWLITPAGETKVARIASRHDNTWAIVMGLDQKKLDPAPDMRAALLKAICIYAGEELERHLAPR